MRRARWWWLWLCVPLQIAAAPPPAGGREVPELAVLDGIMQTFMEANGIGAGTLAVIRDGDVVFDRHYGWHDAERSEPLPARPMMRVASLTKPFTAAATWSLIAHGALMPETRVFDLGDGRGGVLALEPFGTADPRLGDITVLDCLRHRGGWDRDLVGDPTFRELQIAAEMGIPSPPGRANMLRWIMGQPLQHAPNTVTAYSNIGYLALGMVVEQVSGQTLLSYLQQHVLPASGIAIDEVLMGRTFQADQNVREPFYDAIGREAPNVYFPAAHPIETVLAPYGGWDVEARVGQGRLVTTARALVRFADHYRVSGNHIGAPLPGSTGVSLYHTGSLLGSNALMRQRGDGIRYALILNRRAASGTDYVTTLRQQIDAALSAPGLTWPVPPVFVDDFER